VKHFIELVDREIQKAVDAGRAPVELHLAGNVFHGLRNEVRNLSAEEAVKYGTTCSTVQFPLAFRGMPCKQYDLPDGFAFVVHASPETHTLFGLPSERILVPEDSQGQAWVDRNARRRRR
jgi:hypothetical protein